MNLPSSATRNSSTEATAASVDPRGASTTIFPSRVLMLPGFSAGAGEGTTRGAPLYRSSMVWFATGCRNGLIDW